MSASAIAWGPAVLEGRLSPAERCISPSDFGFHNAIRRPDGRLCFVDFEYAGWDDPARVVCDFFCQPAVPVPERYLPLMSAAAAENTAEPEVMLERIHLLLPVYRLKWTCILLNEFLGAGAQRREFAGCATDPEARKSDQLAKARAMLDSACCGVA